MEIISHTINDLNLESQISNTLLNHLYEGIYFVDTERKFRFWNKGAENITGYKQEDILGKNCYDDILHHIDEEGNELCHNGCPLTKAMLCDCFIDARVYLRHKDRSRVPVWVHISPIKNKDGTIIGAVEIFKDDSDYDKLKHANKDLEDLNELKNQFLGMAAHDLRNPLSVISNFSSFILSFNNENLNEKQISMITKMKAKSEEMILLISDLLDITAIESGKINLKKTKTTINKILDINNFSTKLMADHKNINIVCNIDNNFPEFEADERKMHQVMENLLSNAVKFSYPETTITINAEKNGNEIIISVIDQGQGIPEKDLSKIFKPFEKTSVRPTAKESSTGLGLTIVKKIVEVHNGKINIKSTLNKGTTFTITLPLN